MKKFLFIFIFALVAASALPASAEAATLSKPQNKLGLVGYYAFDEGTGTTAHDFSGNGISGTLNGGTLPTWVSGHGGYGLSFDASSGQYVNLTDPAAGTYDFDTGSFTVSFWLKDYGTNPGTTVSFVQKIAYPGASEPGWGVIAGNCSGSERVCFFVQDSSGGLARTQFGQTLLTSGKWQLITAVADRTSGNVYLYLNGVSTGSQITGLSGVGTVSGSRSVNVNLYNTASNLIGKMDDVRLYNRALSATEVMALYQSGSTQLGVSDTKVKDGLVGWWTFDGSDISGTTAMDKSGAGNNGTLVNNPLKALGKIGQALSFNGSGSYVSLSTAFGAPSTVTISAWFKTTATGGAIFGQSSSAPTSGPSSFVPTLTVTTTGTLRGELWTGSVIGITSSGPVNDGKWHHTVIVGNTSTQSLYLDGALVGTRAGTISQSWWLVSQVGTGYDNQNRSTCAGWCNFNGSIDDVHVYNRALSASEVKQIYGEGGSKIGASAQTLQTGSTLSSGLVGYWPFDGLDVTDKVYDRSGNGNNGYLVGTNNATTTRKTIGKIGQGFSVGGYGTGGINLGNSTALNPSRFTIVGWVYLNAQAEYNYIYSNTRDCCSGYKGEELQVNNAGKLSGRIRDATSVYGIDSVKTIPVRTWTQVAFTYDGTNKKIYINGTLDNSSAQTIDPASPAAFNACIGSMGYSSCLQYTLNGALDDVRLYNRALSAAEVKQLYNLGN